jgi:glyoxylase-like metal-dependent hydrolase (beta-lactamase superfamily II)
MLAPRTASEIHRRTFLADMGRGALAVAIVGIAGCNPSTLATFTPAPAGSTPPETPPGGAPSRTGGAGGTAPPASSGAGGNPSWSRVNLGFVSAYVLVRGGEAALVDTGVFDSSDEIEAVLTELGLGWPSLGHVVLTHQHSDHAGSIAVIQQKAPEAKAYAGAEDIPGIGGVELTAVGDGDKVFDLEIVTAPGHTAGSICVLDPVAGVLVAGDALRTDGGKPGLPGTQFTADMDEAKRSIVKLGALTFETLLVGHGDPIESGADALVADLGGAG